MIDPIKPAPLTTETALLPCPHCGGPARLVCGGQVGWTVYCQATFCSNGVKGISPEVAAERWNRRVALPVAAVEDKEYADELRELMALCNVGWKGVRHSIETLRENRAQNYKRAVAAEEERDNAKAAARELRAELAAVRKELAYLKGAAGEAQYDTQIDMALATSVMGWKPLPPGDEATVFADDAPVPYVIEYAERCVLMHGVDHEDWEVWSPTGNSEHRKEMLEKLAQQTKGGMTWTPMRVASHILRS